MWISFGKNILTQGNLTTKLLFFQGVFFPYILSLRNIILCHHQKCWISRIFLSGSYARLSIIHNFVSIRNLESQHFWWRMQLDIVTQLHIISWNSQKPNAWSANRVENNGLFTGLNYTIKKNRKRIRKYGKKSLLTWWGRCHWRGRGGCTSICLWGRLYSRGSVDGRP